MKYIKLLLLSAGVIGLAAAEDYGYLQLYLPDGACRPGQRAVFGAASTLPLKYAYLQLQSGETYVLENKNNIWEKNIALPDNALEGYLPCFFNLVLPETYADIEQVCADIPQSSWRYQSGQKILTLQRQLYITRQTDINISAAPRDPVPGQKILITARTPFAPETALLTYAGQTRPMELTGIIFHAELLAAASAEIKITFQSQGKNIERSVLLTLPEINPAGNTADIDPTTRPEPPRPAEQTGPTPAINGLQVKGSKTIVFINRTADGETDFPEEQRREETLYIEASGRENSVNVAAHILATTQETVDKQEDIMVRLWTERWSAYMGDFTETVAHSYLGLNNKNLNGFHFAYFPGQTELHAIIGKERGADQEEYFYGNDTQGPYAVLYPPAVPGSEQILLDGRPLLRDKDYYFDHRGGKLIFRQNIIARHQLVRVLYQSELTPYKNQFTHARAVQQFGPARVRIDATQARDLAAEPVSGNAPPQERTQYTAQLLYAGGGATLNIEQALTQKNVLNGGQAVSRSSGEAAAASLEYDNQQNLRLALQKAQTTARYSAIGNPAPPGLTEEKYYFEFYPPDYTLRADVYRRDINSGEALALEKENYYKLFVKENFWPEMQLWTKDTQKELVSISSTLNTLRQYSSQNLELAKSLNQNFRLGLTGEQESLTNNLDELPYVSRKTYGTYIQTQGLSSADFIAGQKRSQQLLRDIEQRVSLNAAREEVYLKLNLYPDSKIRLGSSYQQILDNTAGHSELMELDYTLSPWEAWNSNGNYTLETLYEELASVNYRVQKQRGNFLMRYQPLPLLRATLRYAPNISLTAENIPYSFFTGQNAVIDIAPFPWSSLKYTYTGNQAQTKDTARLAENILKTETQNQENMYLLRLLPRETLDLEFKYRAKDKLDNFLDEQLTGNLVYSDGSGREREKGLNIYYRPWKQTQFTNGWSLSSEEMTYLHLPSLNARLEREQYNSGIQQQLNDYWTLYLGCDFFQTTDLLASANNITREYAPGIGLGCRHTEFRARYDYKKIESVQGEKSLRQQHNLTLEYYWSSYLQSSLTVEKIRSEIPAYETTDLLGKLSASF
ncbi:MAG: hypothetical protein LBQ83_01515 [Candidatus Margulisbacteria bacterium]|jgi:hypothetical protein|nr:hypothetical protein [Candidatus Margulisiibacteriota bacterium]